MLSNSLGGSIDLNKEKVSLDYYDKNGNMPMGEIYLTGRLTINGTARMEPGNAGNLWFSTKCNIPDEPAFLRNFCEFNLGSDADYKKLGGPKPSYKENMKCWSNKVMLKVTDPIVNLIDTDSGGTYPSNIAVLKKTKPVFFKCYQ